MKDIGLEPGAGTGKGTYLSYTIGFCMALILTLFAFASVMFHWFSGTAVIVAIVIAAVIQVCVHLSFFLHMNHASTPRWNIIVFAFAMIVIAIVIAGSLFIMYTADQRMMPGMAASAENSARDGSTMLM
jgi:cytochrome o ubiquinol oxidase subunit IV